MKRRAFLHFLYIATVLFAVACVPLTPAGEPTATPQGADNTVTPTAFVPATATFTPEAPPTTEVPSTLTPPPSSSQQFLAYIRDGQLLVTDVTNNVQGGTTQYSLAGQSDQVTDLVWSPSGEFVAFVAAPQGDAHVFYIFALGQSSPTDLGPGSAPAWSPDSTSIAYVGGTNPDNNIWITTIDNPAPRQLTSETNYAWGRIRTPLPGATPMSGVRLPQDLSFSPNGTSLAFSTSSHVNACASPGAYYVINTGGGAPQEVVSPSLRAAIDPNAEHYHVGLSYDWAPASDAIVALGNVVDCNLSGPTPGQVIAGPQMSIIGFDDSERTIIPGFFYGISMDRTGNLIAAAHFQNGFQDLNPNVEIYSAQTGQLVLPLGPGNTPQFQP